MLKRSLKHSIKLIVWALLATLIIGPSILHAKAGVGISPILTGSMRPFAQPGDLFVTVEKLAADLQVGDIITVHSEKSGVFYAHRISEIRVQSGILRISTKGDANPQGEVDPFMVGADKKVSAVTMRIKWLGTPLVFLTSIQGRQGALALMVIANMIALLLFLFNKKRLIGHITEEAHQTILASAEEVIRTKEREIHSLKDLIENLYDEKTLEEALIRINHEPRTQQLTKGI